MITIVRVLATKRDAGRICVEKKTLNYMINIIILLSILIGSRDFRFFVLFLCILIRILNFASTDSTSSEPISLHNAIIFYTGD